MRIKIIKILQIALRGIGRVLSVSLPMNVFYGLRTR
jgi:hypothetical protein